MPTKQKKGPVVDCVEVRTEGLIPADFLPFVERMVNKQVVPALRRVLGNSLILPRYVTICETLTSNGYVFVEINTSTWEIVSFDKPKVLMTPKKDALLFVLTHEMAHYHEIALRRRNSIRLCGLPAAFLWSEYFAQRVTWATGHCSQQAMEYGASTIDTEFKKQQDMLRPNGYYQVYQLMFIWAHSAVVARWREDYDLNTIEFAETLDVGMLGGLYQTFPNWPSNSSIALTKLLSNLVELYGRNEG